MTTGRINQIAILSTDENASRGLDLFPRNGSRFLLLAFIHHICHPEKENTRERSGRKRKLRRGRRGPLRTFPVWARPGAGRTPKSPHRSVAALTPSFTPFLLEKIHKKNKRNNVFRSFLEVQQREARRGAQCHCDGVWNSNTYAVDNGNETNYRTAALPRPTYAQNLRSPVEPPRRFSDASDGGRLR